jgi:hypothetical protein
VDADRFTRLDRMLIAEQRENGVVDLRPDAAESYTVRANRHLLIDRTKKLERYDLATETEPGRWTISDRAEPTLKALGERNDIIKAMHRALADHGIADERGPSQYVTHGKQIAHPVVVGRVLAKGLAGGSQFSKSVSTSTSAVSGARTAALIGDSVEKENLGSDYDRLCHATPRRFGFYMNGSGLYDKRGALSRVTAAGHLWMNAN